MEIFSLFVCIIFGFCIIFGVISFLFLHGCFTGTGNLDSKQKTTLETAQKDRFTVKDNEPLMGYMTQSNLSKHLDTLGELCKKQEQKRKRFT